MIPTPLLYLQAAGPPHSRNRWGPSRRRNRLVNFQPADFQQFVDASKRAMAPLAKLNTLTARTLERSARYQYGVAGDLLELGVAQLQAAAAAKDLSALLNEQVALTNAFFEKSTTRSQEAMQLATAVQGEFTAWVSTATSELGRKQA